MATRHEWTVKLHPDAESELEELLDHVRRNAIEELDGHARQRILSKYEPLRGHRDLSA